MIYLLYTCFFFIQASGEYLIHYNATNIGTLVDIQHYPYSFRQDKSMHNFYLYYMNQTKNDMCNRVEVAKNWPVATSNDMLHFTEHSVPFVAAEDFESLNLIDGSITPSYDTDMDPPIMVLLSQTKIFSKDTTFQIDSPMKLTKPVRIDTDNLFLRTHVASFRHNQEYYTLLTQDKTQECLYRPRLYTYLDGKADPQAMFHISSLYQDTLPFICDYTRIFCDQHGKKYCMIISRVNNKLQYRISEFLMPDVSKEDWAFRFIKPDGVSDNQYRFTRLDYGHEIKRFSTTFYDGHIVGLGWGTTQSKNSEQCKSILTAPRELFFYANRVEQAPFLDMFDVVLKYSTIQDEFIINTNDICAYKQFIPYKNSSTPALVTYTFKSSVDFFGAGWAIHLGYTDKYNDPKELIISFNSDSANVVNRMKFRVDRSQLFHENAEITDQISEATLLTSNVGITGNVKILIDDGIIEVFFENGLYVFTESFNITSKVFDQICIRKFGNTKVSIAQEEILIYSTTEKPKRDKTKTSTKPVTIQSNSRWTFLSRSYTNKSYFVALFITLFTYIYELSLTNF